MRLDRRRLVAAALAALWACSATADDGGGTAGDGGAELLVAVDSLRLRDAPSTGGAVVATLVHEQILTWTGEVSEGTTTVTLYGREVDAPWLRVRTAGGVVGWVHEGALTPPRIALDDDTLLYPLGWSADGKLAYLFGGIPNYACDYGPRAEVRIVDLARDAVLWSATGSCEGGDVWLERRAEVLAAMAEHGVVRGHAAGWQPTRRPVPRHRTDDNEPFHALWRVGQLVSPDGAHAAVVLAVFGDVFGGGEARLIDLHLLAGRPAR